LKISIITVVFNAEKHIQRCLDSIKNQTERIFEHVIIDGSSTDQTSTIVNKYIKEDDGFNKLCISEKDNGVYDAMNKGLNMATGDYYWFLNSDDKLADLNVIYNVKKILSQNQSDMIAGSTIIKNNTKILRIYTSKKSSSRYIPQQPHPSLLVKSKFLEEMNIRFDSSKKIVSDYKMQLEIIKNGGTLHICDNVLAEMYVGGISNSSLKYKILGWVESYKAYKEVFGSGALINTFLKISSKFTQYFIRN